MKGVIDQEALVQMFASATAQQGEQLRQAVRQATLGALQGRELSLKNIKDVLAMVTKAASTGVAQSNLQDVDVENPPSLTVTVIRGTESRDITIASEDLNRFGRALLQPFRR